MMPILRSLVGKAPDRDHRPRAIGDGSGLIDLALGACLPCSSRYNRSDLFHRIAPCEPTVLRVSSCSLVT